MGTLHTVGQECRLVRPLWRTERRFLQKLKLELPYDPAIPLLGIYLEKNMIQKDTNTPMLIAALFTIVKTWKQPKCPSAEEWIKKVWYIYTMEYYSTIKKNVAAAAASLQSCPTQRPHGLQATRLLRPWDSPGKSTGVGCHCLLHYTLIHRILLFSR